MFVCPMLLSYSAPKLATDDPAAQRALFDDFKSRERGTVCTYRYCGYNASVL